MTYLSFLPNPTQVFVGPFTLATSLLSKIDWYSTYDLSRLHSHLLPMGSKRHENWIFFGDSPTRPAIGDWRVSFLVAGLGDPVNAETVSVVGKQTHSHDGSTSLSAFQTTNGDLIDFVYRGVQTKEQIFSSERKSNMFYSWLMRGGGWLLMFIGRGWGWRIIYFLNTTLCDLIASLSNTEPTFFVH